MAAERTAQLNLVAYGHYFVEERRDLSILETLDGELELSAMAES